MGKSQRKAGANFVWQLVGCDESGFDFKCSGTSLKGFRNRSSSV